MKILELESRLFDRAADALKQAADSISSGGYTMGEDKARKAVAAMLMAHTGQPVASVETKPAAQTGRPGDYLNTAERAKADQQKAVQSPWAVFGYPNMIANPCQPRRSPETYAKVQEHVDAFLGREAVTTCVGDTERKPLSLPEANPQLARYLGMDIRIDPSMPPGAFMIWNGPVDRQGRPAPLGFGQVQASPAPGLNKAVPDPAEDKEADALPQAAAPAKAEGFKLGDRLVFIGPDERLFPRHLVHRVTGLDGNGSPLVKDTTGRDVEIWQPYFRLATEADGFAVGERVIGVEDSSENDVEEGKAYEVTRIDRGVGGGRGTERQLVTFKALGDQGAHTARAFNGRFRLATSQGGFTEGDLVAHKYIPQARTIGVVTGFEGDKAVASWHHPTTSQQHGRHAYLTYELRKVG